MLIENAFEVPAPLERTWAHLLDVERVAPCAPGAQLTETVDDRTWKGRIGVKLGPVSLTFAGTVAIVERDDAAHRVVLSAKGQETKGKGAASATVTSWAEELGSNTLVKVQADIALTGTVAQLSRGLLPDVSRRLTAEFAECLRESMSADAGREASRASATEPSRGTQLAGSRTTMTSPTSRAAIGGLRLGLWAVWRAIVRAVRSLLGRR